ncbi:unnamed protein product [Urochloa decumbens]|uniref:FBD domain-containing protein n=1 Tax=Urochloa decumbens TaxID=240449 RepID=A0ABC8VZP6_9POAL
MQLRSGRRLSPPRAPAPGGQRRHRRPPRRPEAGAGGDVEEDRISNLHDDLLLAILARLRFVNEAARTSVLARRWRALWTQLPELFYSFPTLCSLEASLAQVTGPVLDLYIEMLLDVDEESAGAGRVSSLLHDIAERLAPKTFSLFFNDHIVEEYITLACFRTTTTLRLGVCYLDLPPAGNKFEALTTLQLDLCCIELADLLPMCPSLRHLDVTDLLLSEVTIHSPSLEKLKVEADGPPIFSIDISAPLLKEAALDIAVDPHFSFSFSAPMVEKIFWHCTIDWEEENVGLPCMRLSFLDYSLRRGVHQLCLHIGYFAYYLSEAPERSFAQQIEQLSLSPHKLSVLELKLDIKRHAFVPLLLHLLHIRPVKALNVKLLHARQIGIQCPLNCPCEEPDNNWRNLNISLTDLEVVTLDGFNGHDDEVDFLKVLFRCVTVFKRMTVKVSSEGYDRICSICEQYPHVNCNVYLA